VPVRSISVEGVREARERVGRVGSRARRPEPALRADGTRRDILAGERRAFETEGASAGRRWRRLTPGWAAEKRRRGLDPRVLRATGRLRAAATSGGGMTFRVYNGQLWWGIPRGRSDLSYAMPLARGRRGRKMIVIDRVATDRIAMRIGRYVAEGSV
jgi:hypothetical protein